ncbi:MAG: ABC transporter substrate-binding protein [Chloroflexota bacterium]|nr:ABC transporter substrate-binding protein [Chloroflexota bacterium]
MAEAKRLLAEAGFPKGFATTLLLRSLKEYFDMSIATQDQLAKVGITANLEAVDSGIFQTRRAALDYDAMSYATVSVEMGEPDVMLSRFLSGSPGNTFGYSNPKFDELYRKQSQTMDIAERKKLILEVERLWMEEIPYVPWYWKEYVAVVSPRVKDFLLLGLYQGHSIEDVWLTQ